MHFFFKLLCVSLILNVVLANSPPTFKFKNITLGHNGILISWQRSGSSIFIFGYRRKYNRKDENFSFSPTVNSNLISNHKIDSLEENTPYEIIIQQYPAEDEPVEKNYTFCRRTHKKSNTKPAKPDFIFENSPWPEMGYTRKSIVWFPCGRKGNCGGGEAGTHFATKIRIADRRGEYEDVEYFKGTSQDLLMSSGIWYEATVISINKDLETESDPQDLWITPTFTSVMSIEVKSFSNSSILLSWERPKYMYDKLLHYRVTVLNDTSVENMDLSLSWLREGSLNTFEYVQPNSSDPDARVKFFFDDPTYHFERGVPYTFFITPVGEAGVGFETRVKHMIPIE